MPVTKSAIKKQRVDKRRTKQNLVPKGMVKSAIKEVRVNPGKESLSKVYSVLDKAVKKKLIAKRHASRVKARLAKLRNK